MSENTTKRSSAVDRRRVLQGAAWAAPVLATAVATPMASASPCTLQYPGSVRFVATADGQAANYVRGTGTASTTSGSATVALVGAPAKVTPFTVSISSAAVTTGYVRRAENFSLLNATVSPQGGGAPVAGPARFAIIQTAPAGAAPPTNADQIGQTVTFTFPRPVRGLNFNILGFTRSAGATSYGDAAYITGATFTAGTNGIQVSGQGTKANPWFTNTVNADSVNGVVPPQVSTQNTVTGVTFAGPLTTFSIHYYSSLGVGAPQGLFLSNMGFTASCA